MCSEIGTSKQILGTSDRFLCWKTDSTQKFDQKKPVALFLFGFEQVVVANTKLPLFFEQHSIGFGCIG